MSEQISENDHDRIRDSVPPKSLIFTWIIGGLLGLYAAFSLILERIHVAAEPDSLASCDLNPVLSCKSVMLSAQASLFGFPNPIIGMTAFFAPIVVAFSVLAGAKFKAWYWKLYMVGLSFGFIFVLWLAANTIYSINAICLYCIVAWLGTIPMFWATLLWLLREDIIEAPISFAPFLDRAFAKTWLFVLVTELIIALAILQHFWDRLSIMFSVTN